MEGLVAVPEGDREVAPAVAPAVVVPAAAPEEGRAVATTGEIPLETAAEPRIPIPPERRGRRPAALTGTDDRRRPWS